MKQLVIGIIIVFCAILVAVAIIAERVNPQSIGV